MRDGEMGIALLKGKMVNCTGGALSGYTWGRTYQGQSHTDAWIQTPYPVFICAHLVTLSVCLSSAYLLPHSFDSSEWDLQILLIWSSCDFSSFGHGLPGSCLVQCLCECLPLCLVKLASQENRQTSVWVSYVRHAFQVSRNEDRHMASHVVLSHLCPL